MRNWVVENVPGTDTMPGYDLFLALGNDIVAGRPLALSSLVQHLPYSADVVHGQLVRFQENGLVTLAHDADAGVLVHATERFLGMLSRYERVFDTVFIVRDELRGQQLLVQSHQDELANLGALLYDRMHDLGWLYLHNYGSACFLVASLVRRLAELHGHRARIVSGHAEILNRGNVFSLGGKGHAKAGQIDGHAVCMIDDTLMVDFGLGNVRKGYRRDFHWGAIADYRREGPVFARMVFPDDTIMTWKDDWQSPGTEAELANYAPHIEGLVARYVERYR